MWTQAEGETGEATPTQFSTATRLYHLHVHVRPYVDDRYMKIEDCEAQRTFDT